MAATLTLEKILKAKDIIEIDVEVKAWGGSVTVRTLDLAGRYAINELAVSGEGKEKRVDPSRFAAATLAQGLVSPKVTFDEAMKLTKKNAEAVEIVIGAIWDASGMGRDELKNASPKG